MSPARRFSLSTSRDGSPVLKPRDVSRKKIFIRTTGNDMLVMSDGLETRNRTLSVGNDN